MAQMTVDRIIQGASRMVMVAGMAMAVVAMPVAIAGNASPVHAVTSASGEATVSVTVRAVSVNIIRVNDFQFGDGVSSGTTAVKTYNAKNNVTLKTDNDAHVKIVLDGDVLWEGDTKAGQPVNATIDLNGRPVGVYQLEVRASFPDDLDAYSTSSFWLDYQATVPSIIPGDVNAPNTGLYVTIGGRVYSMTTIAILLILAALVVFLACTRGQNREMAKAKAKVKASRKGKKMDMI